MISRRKPLQCLSLFTLGLGLLCLGASPATAHPHRGHHERRGPDLMTQLDLSPEQSQQISAIREVFREQRRELRHNAVLDKAKRRSRLKRLRKDKRAKINAVLSHEQKAKRSVLREAHREKRRSKRLEKMSRRLSLSEKQRGQLDAILRRAAPQGKEIRQDESLDREARKAKLKAHRKQVQSELLALLTPEQKEDFAKFKAKRKMRKAHRRGRRFDF